MALQTEKTTMIHKVMLALDHVLFQTNLWLKSGKPSHIYLHLPTNSNTSKHVNMDMVCNIKPHIRRGSNTCKQMHSINLDSLSVVFKCWDDHTSYICVHCKMNAVYRRTGIVSVKQARCERICWFGWQSGDY